MADGRWYVSPRSTVLRRSVTESSHNTVSIVSRRVVRGRGHRARGLERRLEAARSGHEASEIAFKEHKEPPLLRLHSSPEKPDPQDARRDTHQITEENGTGESVWQGGAGKTGLKSRRTRATASWPA